MRHTTLLALAWLLFATAQFLPAVVPDMGAWNAPDPTALPGWLITALAWPFYVSNAMLVLAPLWVFLLRRTKRARAAMGWLMGLLLLTPFATLAFRDAVLEVASGFWVWAASHLVAAAGLAVAMPAKAQANGQAVQK